MKKIIIPTDFSERTESALIAAKEIALKTLAEVVLLHCVEAPNESSFTTTGEVMAPDIMDRVFVHKSIEVSNTKMKHILHDPRFAGIRLHPKVKIVHTVKEYMQYIADEKPDLVIIGTEEHHHLFKGFLHGTHSSMTISESHCMVLSVKKLDQDFSLKNIVFATNFEQDSPAFIAHLKMLQNAFDFRLHIIYINALLSNEKSTEEIQVAKEAFLKKYSIGEHQFKIIEDFTEYNGIIKYAKRVNADLIALTTHNRTGFHILGGTSNDLVEETSFPILTYRADIN
jgi:nucleotide-binding universal stress UspA family protein